MTSRRLPRTLVVIAAALAVCIAAQSEAQVSPENRLKAAFVSKFPEFVEWPQEALTGRTAVTLCVASPDPFSTDLSELVSGVALNGLPLTVRTVDDPSDVGACHVLFIPAKSASGRTLLAAASARPVLTVSDGSRFLEAGGIVELKMIGGRVRFDIDDGAARRVGLHISSQLLRLAVSVRGDGV